MENQYFSIGEFAELCNTTRASLYHYEKHNLVKPAVNESNGYRFYKPEDYYIFMFITHLANIGYTLSEIAEFLQHHTISNFFELEALGIQRSEERVKQISLRNERTKRGMEHMKTFINIPPKCPQIVYKEEAYFFKLPLTEHPTEYDSVKVQAQTDQYARANHLDRFRHFLGFYFENPFTDAVPTIGSVIGQIIEPKECDKLFIRPAGMYISMCFPGPFQDNIKEVFALMKNYLDKHCFVPLSGLLLEVVIGPFHTSNPDEYISEVTVQIE